MADAERSRIYRKEPDEVQGIQEGELKKGAPLEKRQSDSCDKAVADLFDSVLDLRKGASMEHKGDTLLREFKGMRQIQEIMIEQLETQRLAQAYIFAATSPYELHQSPSSAEVDYHQEANLFGDLCQEYCLKRGYVQGQGCYYLCQAIGIVLRGQTLVVEHLLPAASAGLALTLGWGVADPVYDTRNVLLWYEGIHEAWKELRICMEYVGDSLRLRVLDKDLLDVCLVDLAPDPKDRDLARDALGGMTFRDLDKREIHFPADVKTRPYQQIIATQAANAITKMWTLGRLREDIKKFRLDVSEDLPSRQACLAWIRTMMVHIPDWPVGPEPKV